MLSHPYGLAHRNSECYDNTTSPILELIVLFFLNHGAAREESALQRSDHRSKRRLHGTSEGTRDKSIISVSDVVGRCCELLQRTGRRPLSRPGRVRGHRHSAPGAACRLCQDPPRPGPRPVRCRCPASGPPQLFLVIVR